MKTFLLVSLLSIMLSGTSIYDFKVAGLDGKEIDFARFKGKKVLVVNTASECGYTPQYAELQKLHDKYKGKLVIVGFPANNFGGQEPGSNEEISSFCQKNYGVTFPMAAKVSVTGEDAAPLFKYLTAEAKKNGTPDPVVKWNFTKFLIDENGKLVKVFPSKVSPLSEEITVHLN
ncbi:MAG TPA: glutathione peroxidase [Flavisolibacter sp.]|nr:glutathione peroxidase [Flavisolibacter sp.]